VTAAERAERAARADVLCQEAYASVGAPEVGVALVAVGGYGREELAPYSDLDVVLVLDEGVETGEWAGQVWYPLWDSGANIDHSVRSVPEVLEQAASDLKVALGMLDVRHLAGDPNLTLRLRTAILAAWRRDAKDRLPELLGMVRDRHRLLGELAHASVPDLKEATGGLRDATVLKALVATWLVDVPHGELESCRQALLDVRDAVHTAAGRGNDRIAPELWPDLALLLGLPDAAAAQRHVRGLGRRMTHLSRLTWRRVDAVLRRPPRAAAGRRPQLEPIGGGLAVAYEEVVLDRHARPVDDPCLLLRAAAEAAERDLVLEPTTAARLVAEVPPLPDPWPAEARDLLVRLLAAGPGLLAVWETLDETDALDTFLPEWERVRLLPHASTVHRFTVDRHLVETCIEASALIRRVSRPDVLMVAALLHDIGKGQLTEHCVAGEPMARAIARRLDFDERETELVAALVRWHLLLPETATTRDAEDPATVELVTSRVRDREELELLHALTEADARATSEKAWTSWRASLVRSLVRRCAAVLSDAGPAEAGPDSAYREVEVPQRSAPTPARCRSRWRRRQTAPGSRSSPATGSACSPMPPRCSPCSASRCALPAPGTSASWASRSGTWTAPASTPRCCVSGSRRLSMVGSTRVPGCGRPVPRPWRRPSSCGPRPRIGPPCSRCGLRTARASSTWSVRRSRGSTCRSSRRTSTPSGRRRSTCSTCRSRRPARSATPGRPRRPMRCARR
jgi:[protein-PII] uridylyltransferase